VIRNPRIILQVTADQAAAQWRRILERPPKFRVGKLGLFLPVEVLLSFGMLRVFSARAYGSPNLQDMPAIVPTLADAFRRSSGSLVYKLRKMEGAHPDARQEEVLQFLELTADPLRYANLYRNSLRGAREAGLDEAEVPDFLELLEDDGNIELWGRERIGREELDIALEEQAESSQELRNRFGLTTAQTDQLVAAQVRLGQHRFTRQVLAAYEYRCGFCGSSPDPRSLIASHLKPWRECSPKERVNPRNGIATCETHHAALTSGLISAAKSWTILRSPDYDGKEELAPKLLVPEGAKGPRIPHLRYHRMSVFRKGG
jgi:putative restriction endonuclease